MDRTQEQMKFTGILGIFSQSFKTIFTLKKLFTQISLTLILPLSITIIAHMEISNRFFNKIELNPYQIFTNVIIFYRFYYTAVTSDFASDFTSDDDGERTTSTEWFNYFLFKTTTIAAVTFFSLLSTAATVFAATSIYSGRDVTYRKSMKIVPKIWKPLTATLVSMFLTFLAYNLILSVAFFLCYMILYNNSMFALELTAISTVYALGFMYLSIIWQLASVITVLEGSYGLKAMVKAVDLVTGKKMFALMTSFTMCVFLVGVTVMYMILVLYGEFVFVWRVLIGIICVFLLAVVLLVMIVAETMLYLVLKSCHREAIDVGSLSTFLGAYLSDTQPPFRAAESIQLGRPRNQPVATQV